MIEVKKLQLYLQKTLSWSVNNYVIISQTSANLKNIKRLSDIQLSIWDVKASSVLSSSFWSEFGFPLSVFKLKKYIFPTTVYSDGSRSGTRIVTKYGKGDPQEGRKIRGINLLSEVGKAYNEILIASVPSLVFLR